MNGEEGEISGNKATSNLYPWNFGLKNHVYSNKKGGEDKQHETQ